MTINVNQSDLTSYYTLCLIRQRCKLCGRHFFREEGVRGHLALVHVLGWRHR